MHFGQVEHFISENPVSSTLCQFLQQDFVLRNHKYDEHCSRCGRYDEQHQPHAHGAIAVTNWTISSGSIAGHLRCLYHEDLHFVSVLPNRIEKE